MKISLDWIRHGYSYANLIYDTVDNDFDAMVLSSKYAPDAKLTSIGIKQAQEFNKKHKNYICKYDFVFCSELSRSAETAILLSKNTHIQKIYMMPNISELILPDKSDLENHPDNLKNVKKNMSIKYPYLCGYPKLDTNFVKLYRDSNSPTIPNSSVFYNHILPAFTYHMDISENISIGIVSHREYIHDIFNSNYGFSSRLDNLKFVSEILEYDNRNNLIERDMIEKN